jgi:hypothetical protein
MYTIECGRDGERNAVAMSFADRQVALANARTLVKAGFRVWRIFGPGFEIQGRDLRERMREMAKDPWRDRSLL